MTGIEYVLALIFAAVWLVPLTLAVRWEIRLRAIGTAGRANRD